MLNNKLPHQQSEIFQNQYKQLKNRESHGGVRQDKYANARVRGASDQPVTLSDTPRTSSSNTTIPRIKKRPAKRRLSQLATWVEDPIVFKIQQKARKKGVSTSAAIRRLLINALKDEESIDEALDTESLREAIVRDNRRLAARLSWFLVRILYDVGHIKGLATNTLGMQQSMTQELLKDIVQDANRQTKASLSRQNPDLSTFMDEVEKWLLAHEAGEREPRQTAKQGRGGTPL